MTAARDRLHVLNTHALDFWLARGSILVVVVLQLGASSRVAVGPRWLAPALELALLVPLSLATAWSHGRARRAVTDAHWEAVGRLHEAVRWLAMLLTALVSAVNFASLVLLVRELLMGTAGPGPVLLLDAVIIWVTNIIAFALWFWTVDRSGPGAHSLGREGPPDFLFSNMLKDVASPRGWLPGYVDYLYLSFTNCTALSPADTLPLTQRAKLLMMLESCVSLLTIAIVAARAVNILH